MITPLLTYNGAEEDFIYDNIRGLANPCIKDIYADHAWNEIAEVLDKYFVYNYFIRHKDIRSLFYHFNA